MRSFISALRFLLCIVLIGTASAADAPDAATIGAARVVVADVSAEAPTAKRRLLVDDPVQFRELIATAAQSAAVIALSDGTELAMGENAVLRLDEFVLGDGPDAKLSLSVALGAMRFATGTMPKPAYVIQTPQASLTVRGTVFDLAVGADGAAYVAVREGAITVATASGQSVDVPAGQSLAIDAAGIADLPRATAMAPVGLLPTKLAAMDQVLAAHLAGLDDTALSDLAVLDAIRTLAHDLAGPDLAEHPGVDPHGKPGGDRPDRADRPDRHRLDRERPGFRKDRFGKK